MPARTFKVVLAAALGVFVASTQAETVSVISEAPASRAAVDTSQTLAIDGTWINPPAIYTGNTTNVYRSPFDPEGTSDAGLTNWDSIQYWSVGPDNEGGESATMDFSSVRTGMSLLWGSVDDYNSITLFKFDGSSYVEQEEVRYSSDFNVGLSRLGAALVSITGVEFDRAVFTSTKNAFEFSNVQTVPTPAAAWLFGSGLIALATLKRRKS